MGRSRDICVLTVCTLGVSVKMSQNVLGLLIERVKGRVPIACTVGIHDMEIARYEEKEGAFYRCRKCGQERHYGK